MNNCGNTNLNFSNLFVNRFGNASDPATYFAENIRVECAEPPRDLTIEPTIKSVILDCTPCSSSQLPVIRISRSDRPGVVLRMSGAQESPGTSGYSEEGATVATSLCVTHNGLIDPADPNSFNLFNLRVRSLVRQNGSVLLRELSSAAPGPIAYPGGLRILSSD